MFADILTDDLAVASKFLADNLNHDYAMVIMQKNLEGQYKLSINTEIEPTPEAEITSS